MRQAVPEERRGFGADQIPARPLFDPDNRTLSRVGAGYRNRGKRQPGTVGFQGERLYLRRRGLKYLGLILQRYGSWKERWIMKRRSVSNGLILILRRRDPDIVGANMQTPCWEQVRFQQRCDDPNPNLTAHDNR